MRIVISYPPLIDKSKGYPTLGQNRQFQYFKEPTYIYPVVPATAASMLKEGGHEVIWNDCIAQEWSSQQFFEFIKETNPDLIAFETKTPVIKHHWAIINKLKTLNPGVPKETSAVGTPTPDRTSGRRSLRLKTVLMGDHVTALPEESFEQSQVDFVITGGDYDFLLRNLCDELQREEGLLRAEKLEPGIYYRENNQIKNSGKFQLDHNLDDACFIDRDLTNWQLYAYKNGNYKRRPGTYIMSGRDCWWGKCTFCSWPTLYPKFRTRSVDNVLDEIGELIRRYNVKEIMDDAGSFAAGEWLKDFCQGMIERGYNQKVNLDCNMRFDAVDFDGYKLMKKAGFRLLLFGLESANQETLQRINKNLTVERIVESCKLARKAGLYPHITIMFGYPWEDYDSARNTLELGKYLLKKGWAYTMQATMVIPYPGSPLFEECKQKDLLKTLDWNKYDMKEPIMKLPFDEDRLMQLVQEIYGVAFNPEFLYNKLLSVRDFDDAKYFFLAGKKVLGHIFDFNSKKSCSC